MVDDGFVRSQEIAAGVAVMANGTFDAGLAGLKADIIAEVAGLKADNASVKADNASVKADIAGLKTDIADRETRLAWRLLAVAVIVGLSQALP